MSDAESAYVELTAMQDLGDARPQRKQLCGMRRSLGLAVVLLLCLSALGVGLAVFSGIKKNQPAPKAPPPAPSHSATSTPSPTASASPSQSQASMTPSASATPSQSPTASFSANSSATPSPLPSVQPPPQSKFLFWNGLSPNTSAAQWFDPLDVNANTSFLTRGNLNTTIHQHRNVTVQVDWADHHAVQLFANPAFLQSFDDSIRAWNNNASLYSGNIDACGWPDSPLGAGWSRRTSCFHEDFANGWDSDRITVSLAKSCCTADPILLQNWTWWPKDPHSAVPPLPYEGNIKLVKDVVEYPQGVFREKNVLRLTAVNMDDTSPEGCGACEDPTDPVTCPNCHKAVLSAGLVQTADLFASGKYEVIAKVPAASGLVWAMWTFHYEEHLPFDDCGHFGCYKESYVGEAPPFAMQPNRSFSHCCGVGCCEPHNRPAYCPPADSGACACCKGYSVCAEPTLCNSAWGDGEKKCMAQHAAADPQNPGNASVNSWKSQTNHEIDIEIPANCQGTSVCTVTANPSMNFTQRKELRPGCIRRYNTANLNNYIFTTTGGTGPAYSNMCVKLHDNTTGEEIDLIGGDKYRKYTIDWHTGGDGIEPHVDFFVDDMYLGTNNVFVPTRASRLTFGMWAPKNNWNNWGDDWSGKPGDGVYYTQHAYVSEVKITPHNEKNDIVYPANYDQPDDCTKPYDAPTSSCHRLWEKTSARAPVVENPQAGVLSCPSSP